MRRIAVGVFVLVTLLLGVFSVGVNNSVAGEDLSGITLEQDSQIPDFPTESEFVIEPDILPFPAPSTLGFLGQEHSYSVVFRGNGEAVVSARIAFTNTTDSVQRNVRLRVPKVEPRDLVAYQVVREQICLQYGFQSEALDEARENSGACSNYTNVSSCNSAQRRAEGCSWYGCVDTCLSTGISFPEICSTGSQTCVEYQQPDYFQPYGISKYKKANVAMFSDTMVIDLPRPVAPNESGAFFLYYKADRYTKRDVFGGFDYEFETLEVEQDVRSVQVGISTDSDLKLKGATTEVNYRFEDAVVAELSAGPPSRGVGSVEIDSFYSQIGYGSLVKTVSNLSASESFTVEGRYAENYFELYGRSILLTLTTIVFVIGFIAILARVIHKGTKKGDNNKPRNKALMDSLIIGITSFLSVNFIAGFTVLLYVFSQVLESGIGYQYSFIVVVLMFIISIGVYALFMILPSIIIGYKRGLKWGIANFVLTILILIMYFFAIIVLFSLNVSSRSYPPVLY